jgi:putative membrane protein
MGGADVIPGVSGGTMALIVGIYERLVGSISTFFAALIGWLPFGQAGRPKVSMRQVDWLLVLPLGAGIASAILIGARFIPYLLETYPHHCRGLFLGLIAASVPIPWARANTKGGVEYALVLASAVAAFVLTGLRPLDVQDPSMPQIFGAAAVAICAMILPGISGAFLLLVLGMYEPTLHALHERDVVYVAVFLAGIATGIGLFSHLLKWLLTRYHDRTMAALVGLMIGSLRALWPWQGTQAELLWPATGDPVVAILLLALAGFAIVTALNTWGQRRITA